MINDYIKYEVKPKDTLFNIAKQFNTTPKIIYELNKLDNTMIYPGQILNVPNITTKLIYTNDDTLESIEKKYNVYLEDIIEANDILKLKLKDNQLLVLPNVDKKYIIKEHDTLDSILDNLKITPKELLIANSNEWLISGKSLKY